MNDSDEPAALAGLARVQILLTDGGSPLYDPRPEGALDELVERAERALEID
jgi:hypothetical protein